MCPQQGYPDTLRGIFGVGEGRGKGNEREMKGKRRKKREKRERREGAGTGERKERLSSLVEKLGKCGPSSCPSPVQEPGRPLTPGIAGPVVAPPA